MKLAEARELFRQLTKEYFQTATVIFGRQSRIARPDMPLVSITHGDVTRCQFPPRGYIDGCEVASYPTKASVRVDLFTHGAPVLEGGIAVAASDTAVDDLLAFSNFLESVYAIEWCRQNDIAISTNGEVKSLTGILNETNYEFRAQLNLSLYFIQRAVGRAGILGDESLQLGDKDGDKVKPDFQGPSSGGGSQDLADLETGYFTSAEITEQKEGKTS